MVLAGFTPGFAIAQDHIHLGAVPNDGSMPIGFDGDGAPPYKIYHIQKRLPRYEGYYEFVRSWNGTPVDHVLRTDDLADPITFTGFVYEVRVDLPTLDLLTALLLRKVYLIDNRHPNNGINHSAYVRIMLFEKMEFEENLEPMLQFNIVNITFTDEDTVSA